jgi:hypothetical protein
MIIEGKELAVALHDGADALLAVIDGECVIDGRPPGLRISACCFVCGRHRPPLEMALGRAPASGSPLWPLCS